jgi:cytochrome c oxidase cbb3-type subunit 4
MWQQHFQGAAGSAVLHFPMFALVLFMIVFAGVVAWVYLATKPRNFERVAGLPLDDGQGESHV